MGKFDVTLKQLREHKACVSGYNKVVCALKGVEYTDTSFWSYGNKETYMRHKHDEPISLLSILESNGLDSALWCLRCNKDWDGDSRLYAVWCARQVQHLMTDERSIASLVVAEKFALGLATLEELSAARDTAISAAAATESAARYAAISAAAAAEAVTCDAARYVAIIATAAATLGAARAAARAAQKEMFIRMCNGTAEWQINEGVK